MKQVYSLQRQHRKHGSSATTSVSFAEPTRLFAPVAAPSAPLSSHERQEPSAHVAQFRHSFDRFSIHPPVPTEGADSDVEQSGKRSDMQQTEEQSSSVQRKEAGRQPTPKMGEPLQKVSALGEVQENHTGMPDTLKAGIESHSGLTMDDVRVHYNSAKPAQVNALAYTQGTEIHVGPGQEQHLAHEAWHVVQQKQGWVKPTLQMKGMAINDDRGLEREADVMGKRIVQASSVSHINREGEGFAGLGSIRTGAYSSSAGGVVQCYNLHVVDYYTSPYSQDARDAREDNEDFTGVNYATFWVRDRHGIDTPTTRPSATYHSEKECWLDVGGNDNALQDIQITTWQPGNFGGQQSAAEVRDNTGTWIAEVYTERQPCNTCAPLLNEILPTDANVYYSFDYPSEETAKFQHDELDPDTSAANTLLTMKYERSYKEQAKESQKVGRKVGNRVMKRALTLLKRPFKKKKK